MKKQIIAGGFLLASLGASFAQGLYDVAPTDEIKNDLPLTFSTAISVAYDSNVTPTVTKGNNGYNEDSVSASAYVGAAWVSITPQTTWDVYARIGATYYFDAPSSVADDSYAEGNVGVNWTHRVSDRLRLSSRNYFASEMEPDYNQGVTLDRQFKPYLNWASDNSVGFKLTELFATYTGLKFSGVDYDSKANNNDRSTVSLYNQFRYRATEQTVWTLDYRYSVTNSNGAAADSDSHYFLAGLEHRFSPNTVGVAKAGVQYRNSDSGKDYTSPFFEGALRTRMNEQLSGRVFARYSIEDYGTSFRGYGYDSNDVFRLGIASDYKLSPQLTLHGGINYVMTAYQGATDITPDLDQDVLNAHIGFSYEINETFYLTGSYNYTDSSASGGGPNVKESRSYDRNHASLGVRFQF